MQCIKAKFSKSGQCCEVASMGERIKTVSKTLQTLLADLVYVKGLIVCNIQR